MVRGYIDRDLSTDRLRKRAHTNGLYCRGGLKGCLYQFVMLARKYQARRRCRGDYMPSQ